MPIYDQTYRRIEGIRPAGRFRFLPIARTGLGLFFRKKIYLLFAFFALGPFFLMMLPLAAPHLLSSFDVREFPPEVQRLFHLSADSLYAYLTFFEWAFVFLFAILTGGGLIANDLRANALEIYFSRPITVVDYLLGKLLVVLSVMLGVTLLPCLVLWVVDVSLSQEEGFWRQQLPLLPKIVGASLLYCLPYALLSLAASALVKSARTAMLVFAGGERILQFSAAILTRTLDDPAWGLVSITRSMDRLAAAVLGPDAEIVATWKGGEGIPLLGVPLWMPAAAWTGVCAVCVIVVLRRVRGVEVVKG